MTDYKHFPRVIRPAISDRQYNRLLFVVMVILVLITFSLAGREDMAAQAVIDQAVAQERLASVTVADERAALSLFEIPTKPVTK